MRLFGIGLEFPLDAAMQRFHRRRGCTASIFESEKRNDSVLANLQH